jgi:hypothetical protein
VVQQWTSEAGHYPAIAYQTACALNLALQVAAWIWFALPRTPPEPSMQYRLRPSES